MSTNQFLRISAAACFAAILFSAAAEAQPPRGGRGDENGGRQRGGQGGPGGQRGGQQRGGQGGPGGQRGGQQRGGFGGQRGGTTTISRAMLLSIEDVKDELKIDDGQGATLDAAIEAYNSERNESRPDMSGVRDMSEDERTAFFAKMTKDREALVKKTDETIDALLEPEQVTRLNQIAFQIKARNLIGMLKSDEELKKSLKVTEEQTAKLDEAIKAGEESQAKMREDMRAAFGGGGERPNFDDIREKMETLRKENDEKVMAVLTAEQKNKLEEMKGKPFEIDMRSFTRGGRGGQGGGRGGRGGQGGQGGGRGQRQRPPTEEDPVI